MDRLQRLQFHLEEAAIHIERLESVIVALQEIFPLDMEKLENLSEEQKDRLDVLAFRFSKLQDLLGSKIFREYLSVLGYPVEEKNFLELLKELDKEKIISIDKWSEFRGVRNSIAHDYPFDEEQKIEAINYLIKNVQYLIDVTDKIGTNLATFR